jgi:hypothetical protein
MIRAVRWSAAAALVLAAGSAGAFVRETTTPGHPESGLCLGWAGRQVTVKVNATSASYAPCQDATAAAAAAVAGLAPWAGATRPGGGSACTDFRFVDGGNGTGTAVGHDGVNLLVFRSGQCQDENVVPPGDACWGQPGACAAKFNCWEHGNGIIALTTTVFDTGTGELLDADVEMNGWDGQVPWTGSYFTCEGEAAPICGAYGELGCRKVDVAAVVTHESGHMLGLDHVCASYPAPYDQCPSGNPVMAPQVGNVSQRALSADDVEGVCTIYPAGGPTLTCASAGKPKDSGGCASAGSGGLAALLVAGAWAARRWRRRGR